MEKLVMIKEQLNGLRSDFSKLIDKNGKRMYEGIFEVIDELEKDDELWLDLIKEIDENGDFEDEDDGYKLMILSDDVDKLVFKRFVSKFVKNLYELGWEYVDEEYWSIDWSIDDLTCYGVIWDYWVDLDTCVRESMSEIFDDYMEELISK